MFVRSDPAAALSRFADAVDDLTSLPVASLSPTALLDLLRGLETQLRRLATVDHAVVGEIDQRHLAHEHACRDTAALLRQLLRIDPHEAAARVRAAEELGARRSLTAEELEPVFPSVAQACGSGSISPKHARLITKTINALPAAVQAEHDREVERFLVDSAQQFDPQVLGTVAARVRATLDQDGTLQDERDRDRQRDLTIHQRRDGSAHIEGTLTAICTEALLTVLDTLGRPNAAADGARDPRTAGQRRHDALQPAMLTLLRSDELPMCNGVAATILVTMTSAQLASGEGLATTGHGGLISAAEALTLLGDSQLVPVIFTKAKGVESYGSAHRIFTQAQRLAMIARDGGCTFPGCDVGPMWCQAHHVTDFQVTGHTRVDDGALACGYHHRDHLRLGWVCRMLDGVPHWVPPAWLDTDRVPRRNHVHTPLRR